MTRKIIVPKFATEEEEANWWYDNREEHSEIMAEAFKNGETTTLAKELERHRKRLAAEPKREEKRLAS
jgi:hypothetical protein